jgi:hypothetical protein
VLQVSNSDKLGYKQLTKSVWPHDY